MSTYSQFKSSGVDWLDEIPSQWKASSLKRVATIQTGLTLGKVYDGLIIERPYLRVANVQDGHLNLEDITTIEVPAAVAKRVELQPGDVLMTEGGDLNKLGRGFLWNAEVEGCLHQNHIFALRCFRHKLIPKFLTYLTSSQYGRDYFESTGKRTTNLASTSSTKVGAFPVPLPPLPEQERIAAYLDASCAAIDTAVAAKRRQLETLDALRKDVIQRVVTRGLNEQAELRQTGNTWMEEVPVGWDLVCLKRVSEIQTGLTLGKVYDGPLIERPYLRVANVQDGHLDMEDVTTIEVPADVARRVELRVNDVLMTEGGDLDKLARGFLWNGQIPDCLHQNHIFAVRCFRHKLLPKFLTYLTASRYGRDYFEATGKRTTNLASTNSTKVGAFPLPLPSVEEQARLVEYLEEQLDGLRSLLSNLHTQIETLLAYRKSLIHECVTGQRRISEADLNRVVAHARQITTAGDHHCRSEQSG